MSSSSDSESDGTQSQDVPRFDTLRPISRQHQVKDAGGSEPVTPQSNTSRATISLPDPYLLSGRHPTCTASGIAEVHGVNITGEPRPFTPDHCHKRERDSDLGYCHEKPDSKSLVSQPYTDLIPEKSSDRDTVSSVSQSGSPSPMVHCKSSHVLTSQTVNGHRMEERRDVITGMMNKPGSQLLLNGDVISVISGDSSVWTEAKTALRLKGEEADSVDNLHDVYIDLNSGCKGKGATGSMDDDLSCAACRTSRIVTDGTEENGYRNSTGCGKTEVFIGVLLTVLVLMVLLTGTVVHLQMRVSTMEKVIAQLVANVDRHNFAEIFGHRNYLSDKEDLLSKALLYLDINDDLEVDQKTDTDQKGRILSRHTRDVVLPKNKMNPETTQQASNRKQDTKIKGKNKASTVNLESSQFEFNFFDEWYDYRTNFSKQDCIQDKRWPTHPFACKGSTIRYPQRDSPLAFYVPQKLKHTGPAHKTRHRKGNTPLLEISNRTEGYFSVRESGVYLIHLNIMIVDETQSHWLGILLNNVTVLACPRGGFRCPHTNAEGSNKYRVCNIDGILEMNVNDQLQIRTMETNTTVRFDNKRKSQFRAVLLHKAVKTN